MPFPKTQRLSIEESRGEDELLAQALGVGIIDCQCLLPLVCWASRVYHVSLFNIEYEITLNLL